jgi:hypothetical protein
MNVNHVKAIIEEALGSIPQDETKRQDPALASYWDALEQKINNLKHELCSDQKVETFDDLGDDKNYCEVSDHVADLTNVLQQS